MSRSLPVSVLLGTDVPELGELLQSSTNTVHWEYREYKNTGQGGGNDSQEKQGGAKHSGGRQTIGSMQTPLK